MDDDADSLRERDPFYELMVGQLQRKMREQRLKRKSLADATN
jgi:hypothetical protein